MDYTQKLNEVVNVSYDHFETNYKLENPSDPSRTIRVALLPSPSAYISPAIFLWIVQYAVFHAFMLWIVPAEGVQVDDTALEAGITGVEIQDLAPKIQFHAQLGLYEVLRRLASIQEHRRPFR